MNINMEFINYPREYERVFSGSELLKKKCDIKNVSTLNNIPSDLAVYGKMYKDIYKQYYEIVFETAVKSTWLTNRFCYKGARKDGGHWSIPHRVSFGVYLRAHLNIENRIVMRSNAMTGRIKKYFPDFFPNFDEGNPFEEDYKYPYNFMTLPYLCLIYLMPEKINLLNYGEARAMPYVEFMDYILNYISCYNEKKEVKYEFSSQPGYMPYVKVKKDKVKK